LVSASFTSLRSANSSSQSRLTDSSSEPDVIDKHDTKSNKHHTNLMPLAVLPSAIARSTNTIQLMPFGSVELEAIDGMLLDIWRHRDHQTGKRRGKMSLRCRLPHPDGAWSGAPPHLSIGGAFHCRHARPGRDRVAGWPGPQVSRIPLSRKACPERDMMADSWATRINGVHAARHCPVLLRGATSALLTQRSRAFFAASNRRRSGIDHLRRVHTTIGRLTASSPSV